MADPHEGWTRRASSRTGAPANVVRTASITMTTQADVFADAHSAPT